MQAKTQEKKLSLNGKKISDLAKFMVQDAEAVKGGVLADCHVVLTPAPLPPTRPGCDRLTGSCGSMSGW